MKKIISLLILNIFAIFILFYLLDLFSIFNLYSAYRRYIQEEQGSQVAISIKELDLLEQEKHKKLIESFRKREEKIVESQANLQKQQKRLEQRYLDLELERKKLQNEISQFQKKKLEENQYQKKIDNIAKTFSSMEPEKVVARVEKISDNRMVIDIFSAMNRIAALNGKKSIVPFLYSIMKEEKSATLLELSALPNYSQDEN